MNVDLKIIKKKYGEQMMHLCRNLFSSLLEQAGLLSNLMLSHFEPSRFLYDDIVDNYLEDEFKNYIYSFVDVERKEGMSVKKTPKELLDEAGYVLYECKTEDDIQRFEKYYNPEERICTFNGGRLERCYVFFAVKKNVGEIKREDFKNPKRQDEYGTSVISIQFTKGKMNTLSIKNRYNHTVNNPDATFSNNLDNIISGLTDSFEREYKFNINQNVSSGFEIPGYVQAGDGKFYKYNYEINNVYYCPNNIIIDNFEVIDKYTDKERYVVIDYFVIDLVNKQIRLYDDIIEDSFIDRFESINKINITKVRQNGNKIIEIITKDRNKIIIELDKFNRIIGYHDENIIEIGDQFLYLNKVLTSISLPNLTKVGRKFLHKNMELISLNLPKLTGVSDDFLYYNKKLINLNLPKLVRVGSRFLYSNIELVKLDLPYLSRIGYGFLYNNSSLGILSLPNLMIVGDNFLTNNTELISLDLPKLVKTGFNFLCWNEKISKINLPNLTKVCGCFLYNNKQLISLNLPSLEIASGSFLYNNVKLRSLSLPKLVEVGKKFLYSNLELTSLNLPNLERLDEKFLYNNSHMIDLVLPKLSEEDKDNLREQFQLAVFKESCLLQDEEIQSSVVRVEEMNSSLSKILVEKIMNIRYKIKDYREIILNKFRRK